MRSHTELHAESPIGQSDQGVGPERGVRALEVGAYQVMDFEIVGRIDDESDDC